MTVMSNEQDAPAASDPPVREIVFVAAVAVTLFVPPQLKVPSAMVNPEGSTSEKLIPLKARLFGAPLGLAMLNVNVVVLPLMIGALEPEKLLLMVGGRGWAQPDMTTSSTYA